MTQTNQPGQDQPHEDHAPPRLRPHPDERFHVPQLDFDLHQVAAALRAEAAKGNSGHRQETLYHRGGMTVALFLFAAHAQMRQHRAKGVVVIQVCRGHLRISAEGKVHELAAGRLLILAPNVEHDVVAQEETEMLLTVYLSGTP